MTPQKLVLATLQKQVLTTSQKNSFVDCLEDSVDNLFTNQFFSRECDSMGRFCLPPHWEIVSRFKAVVLRIHGRVGRVVTAVGGGLKRE